MDQQITTYMVSLITILLAGILLGYFLRKKKTINLNKVTLLIIIVLIFSMGFSIGTSRDLFNSILKVGFGAIVITLLVIGFSLAFVFFARRLVGIK